MNKRVAIVTGASRGIGEAIARALITQDFHVVMCSRDVPAMQHISEETATAQGKGSAEVCYLDVTDELACRSLVNRITEEHGRVDVLVNNAGVALDKWQPGADVSLDICKQTFDVNVWACLSLCQAVLPHMRERKYGRIVNISSELGSLESMDMGMTLAYRASKTALNAITKILAVECRDFKNIKINAAAPGWVKTELGGEDAPLTTEEGAVTPVWLATLAENGPTGGFFKEKQVYPW